MAMNYNLQLSDSQVSNIILPKEKTENPCKKQKTISSFFKFPVLPTTTINAIGDDFNLVLENRPATLNTGESENVVNIPEDKPNQPRLFSFPKKDYERRKQLQSAKNKEKTFTLHGFSNWKKALDRFREHQKSTCHLTAVDAVIVVPKTCQNIAESLSDLNKKEMQTNRKMLLKILENIQFLARQGVALQGHTEEESNFFQLFKLRANDDPEMLDWLKKKSDKYTSHDIQNELINILALQVIRDISESIKDDGFFALLADECTDVSNKEQLAICIRHVDQDLNAFEDFLGFYHIPNINANTIVAAIKDVLLRMNLSLFNCRGQCYDAGGPMAGCKNGVAVQILSESPTAFLTHCYGHALSLAVHDMTKGCKILSDAMDTTREICKLIKFSPKREGILNEIKKNINLETAGIKVLCPTRGDSFQRIIENYEALLIEWDLCLEGKLDTEMRARITGAKAQMEKFNYFFAINLGARLFTQTDNLSKTLQQTKLSALEGQRCANLVVQAISTMRTDDMFALFYEGVKIKAKQQAISDPQLPRHRRTPVRFEPGTGESYHPESIHTYYRNIYFEAVDLVTNAIKQRFDQPGVKAYIIMESLLIKGLNSEDITDERAYLNRCYGGDVNIYLLESQLPLFKQLISSSSPSNCFDDIYRKVLLLSKPEKSLLSEIMTVIRLILVNPATDAVSERSFSTARRLKTWLRSSMNQQRYNNLACLTVHSERTSKINLVSVANEFATRNENRKRNFGHFD